ncbi:MATE family efflux transporter [Bacterioplanes sanyensis]|uniref:Multidrug-efflux transporter n=1 Tax=Bacterioplanes sanyensis TaxID=1249553 RepID=A0A222FN81_9GAMM|nr:MATE family efflux transporter [Bacterioplanes sanyensis]ASP39673.1 MATE family efflux transporter [Bacterioplanes sanyensis]
MPFTRHELRALTRLTLPILATQMAQIGMGTVDTLMSGYVSTRDLAAVAIGTSFWTPVWLFLAGILVALSPLTARLNAAARGKDLPQLLAAALWLGIVAGAIAGVFLYAMAQFISSWVDDPDTARIAADYLTAIAIGMPGAGVFLAYRFYAEALNQASHVTWVMLSGLLLNIPINAVLVYGWFGLPALGGVGCGIGSAIVFAGMALAMAINTRKYRLQPEFRLWRRIWKPKWQRVRQLVAVGLPIGTAIFFEVSLFSVIALFLTELGPTVVAGHQVALNVSSLTFMIPLSLGMALTVRVGHHLGAGAADLARQTAWLGVKLNLGIAVFNASLITLLAAPIASLYSPDPAVVSLAAGLLLFAAVFQLSDSIQISAAGALRGYQDTLPVMIITFIAYWLVGLGLGYWLAFDGAAIGGPMGAKGFWIGLVSGLTVAAIALGWRLANVARQPLRHL